MDADLLIAEIERAGGTLTLAGERIRYKLPHDFALRWLPELQAHRDELLALLRQRDANYHAHVEAALLATCCSHPAGLVRWLETYGPGLYDDLTRRLPEFIHALWMAHAPLEEFQRVVDEWLATHRRACDLYREHGRGACHE